MISVEEATKLIQSHLYTPKVISKPLDECLGFSLAEDVYADRDFPPFNRVAMDGIAILASEFISGSRIFGIEGTQFAGMEQLTLKEEKNCFEVMTGAMLPNNTDCVIRYEDLVINKETAEITVDEIKQWQNVHIQASDSSQGSLLITKNTKIGPAEIGVLATVGRAEVQVYAMPSIAIVSTGDELVNVEADPKAYQIRRSNSHVLKSALAELRLEASIFHINDVEVEMKKKLSAILGEHDVLILSGGVSKGKKDFVPGILEELGVKKHFHRVAQKPGKPFWFGTATNTTVFALPGNPVSTFLCYYKYIQPWIAASLGSATKTVTAILDQDMSFSAPLSYFAQVEVEVSEGYLVAKPVLGKGSGDLRNLLEANGFIQLPPEETSFKKGDPYPIFLYRSIG